MTTEAPPASPAPPQVLLAHHLRQLKLPTFLREYQKAAAEPRAKVSIMSASFFASPSSKLIDRESSRPARSCVFGSQRLTGALLGSADASCPSPGIERRQLPAQAIEGAAAARPATADEEAAAADPETDQIIDAS